MQNPILFDLDGTLMNTLPDIHSALNSALTQHAYQELSLDEVRKFVGNGLGELARKALVYQKADEQDPEFIELHARVLKSLKDLYTKEPWKDSKPYEGIPELLRILKEKDLCLGVLTNKAEAIAKQVLDHFFPGIFTVLRGESPQKARKPSPEALWDALEGFRPQLDPENRKSVQELAKGSWLIGDSEVDVRTALDAGCPCIAACWGFRSKEELIQAGAKIFAAEPLDVLPLLGY